MGDARLHAPWYAELVEESLDLVTPTVNPWLVPCRAGCRWAHNGIGNVHVEWWCPSHWLSLGSESPVVKGWKVGKVKEQLATGFGLAT